eukprot:TRINITY_DN57142_c0_g1_i1.p1 TRINITY_DN57142_c0_g1~~TRINITY_DN57142_c0_g1_i1.p1  ORF type:complete len:193 (+),score=15.50 TRINITY_DN57142_c0_g1_i1:38-616(+)
MDEDDEEEEQPSALLESAQRKFQHYVDKSKVWPTSRWISLIILMIVYCIRIYLVRGFHVVTYGLAIYILNLFIGFLSPAVDPETEEEGGELPTRENSEFRPFTRKVPEFTFWSSAVRALLIGIFLTFFRCFDLPVFWPILLGYFIILVILTMKDRVRHMMKHKYVPFSVGKKSYADCAKVDVPGAKDAKSDT